MCIVLHCTRVYCIVLYSTTCNQVCYTVLCSTVAHYIILNYTVVQGNIVPYNIAHMICTTWHNNATRAQDRYQCAAVCVRSKQFCIARKSHTTMSLTWGAMLSTMMAPRSKGMCSLRISVFRGEYLYFETQKV